MSEDHSHEEARAMNKKNQGGITKMVFLVTVIAAVFLLLGTIYLGRSASKDTQDAVQSVSMLYLDELAGRREQVVESNLNDNIENIYTAVGLLTENDLSDLEHLQVFQSRMKKLYDLEKFAFVDTSGTIYTSLGLQYDIDQYDFDYENLNGPEISVKDLDQENKKVIIAVPIEDIEFGDETLKVCFMENRDGADASGRVDEFGCFGFHFLQHLHQQGRGFVQRHPGRSCDRGQPAGCLAARGF